MYNIWFCTVFGDIFTHHHSSYFYLLSNQCLTWKLNGPKNRDSSILHTMWYYIGFVSYRLPFQGISSLFILTYFPAFHNGKTQLKKLLLLLQHVIQKCAHFSFWLHHIYSFGSTFLRTQEMLMHSIRLSFVVFESQMYMNSFLKLSYHWSLCNVN